MGANIEASVETWYGDEWRCVALFQDIPKDYNLQRRIADAGASHQGGIPVDASDRTRGAYVDSGNSAVWLTVSEYEAVIGAVAHVPPDYRALGLTARTMAEAGETRIIVWFC